MTPSPDNVPVSLHAEMSKVCDHLIKAGKKAREPYLTTGKEVWKYAYAKEYEFLYQDVDSELFLQAKVPKAAEFIEIIGPMLYPTNPSASVNSKPWADRWAKQRHLIEQDYLEYIIEEGDLYLHARRTVDHAMVYGRGVVWTGYNTRKKIVQNIFESSENLLIDGDADRLEDANWVARIQYPTRWQLMQKHPGKRALIMGLSKCSTKSATEGDVQNDIIEVYRIYCRSGLHRYSSALVALQQQEMAGAEGVMQDIQSADAQEVDDSPRVYVVADGKLLGIEKWEIPFFLDDTWPCELLDLREKPGEIWPAAPLEAGLGYIKLLNWAVTLYASQMRIATRIPFVVANYNGTTVEPDQLFKILHGEYMDVATITVHGEEYKISDLIQQFKIETGFDELERFVGLISSELAKSVGLYDILHAGSTSTQIRSARDAELKDQNSRSRAGDMQEKVQRFMSRVFRKSLFAARFLEDPARIGEVFGPAAAKLWGTLAPPEQVMAERQERTQMIQSTLQQIQMAQAQMPPRIDPMSGMPMPPPPIPSAEDLEDQLGPPQFLSMETWINEADRKIEAGSMRRMNEEAQIENMNVALNQLGPAVAPLPGGPALIGAIAVEFGKLNRYSPDFQAATQRFAEIASQPPPPPPMPMGPPPGDAGGRPDGVA